jgi:hypothetical protein
LSSYEGENLFAFFSGFESCTLISLFVRAPWSVPESSHILVGIPIQRPVERSYDQHFFGIAQKGCSQKT